MPLRVNPDLLHYAHQNDSEESEALMDAYNHAVDSENELWSDELRVLAYELAFYLSGQGIIYLTAVDELATPQEYVEDDVVTDFEDELEEL